MTISGLTYRLAKAVLRIVPSGVLRGGSLAIKQRIAESRLEELKSLGLNARFSEHVIILNPECVAIESDCHFNDFVNILGGGGVTIGRGVWVASHVSIVSRTHLVDVEYIGDHRDVLLPVIIEDYVWIGSHAVILPGVRLGRSCVVGAGSIVTRDVPPYAIVTGVPAAVRRYKSISTVDSMGKGK